MAMCNICSGFCPMSESICSDCYFGRSKETQEVDVEIEIDVEV